MMSLSSRIASALCLAGVFSTADWTVSAAQPTAEENLQVAQTIERYFAGILDYRTGDLICRSQVEELQRYLRKTRGNIPAAHRRLLHRVLADEAPLIRLFYGEHGEKVLGTAAGQLAGYAELDSISRLASGRILIKEAIQSDQPDVLEAYAKRETAAKPSHQSQQARPQGASTGSTRIHTVEQFIEAALATPSPGEQDANG
jgi:hypothetical protein